MDVPSTGQAPVEAVYNRDEMHKVGQSHDVTKCTKYDNPRKGLQSVTKVTFDELWIYSSKSEEMKGLD